jgi:hypothetical protein
MIPIVHPEYLILSGVSPYIAHQRECREKTIKTKRGGGIPQHGRKAA